MSKFSKIKFGSGLSVTDEGGGVITVSGSGSGGAVDISGKVDRDAVEAATNRLVQVKLAAGDAQPAFKIQGDGKHLWGAGGSTAADVTLARPGAGRLQTNAQLEAAGGVAAQTGAASQVFIGDIGDGKATLALGPAAAVTIRATGTVLETRGETMFQVFKDLYAQTGGAAQMRLGDYYGYPAVMFGPSDVAIYRSAAGVLTFDAAVEMLRDSGVANKTVLKLGVNGVGNRDVVVGPADSAGAGYRTLRIAN